MCEHKGKRKISVKDHKSKKEHTPDEMGDARATLLDLQK